MPPEPLRPMRTRSANGKAPAPTEPLRAAPKTPEVAGLLSRTDADRTADTIAACQLPSGLIPRFDGGVADPWNHVEAAMALAVAGRRSEAEAAYGWLARAQRPDGSWHQYYTAKGVDQDKLDANTIAYVATGVWHHWLRFGDAGFLEEMWPVVQRALDFVLDLQTPRARSCGPDTPTAPRGRSRCSPDRRRSATACDAVWPSRMRWARSAPAGSWPWPGWCTPSATSATRRSPPRTAGRWTGTTRC